MPPFNHQELPVRYTILALSLLATPAMAQDATITITQAEQQALFSLDGDFHRCLTAGGMRCVLIRDWLQSKIGEAPKPKPEPKKPE